MKKARNINMRGHRSVATLLWGGFASLVAGPCALCSMPLSTVSVSMQLGDRPADLHTGALSMCAYRASLFLRHAAMQRKRALHIAHVLATDACVPPKAVRNGPGVMPGAVAVEDELGRVISLATFTPEVRILAPTWCEFVTLVFGLAGLCVVWRPAVAMRSGTDFCVLLARQMPAMRSM